MRGQRERHFVPANIDVRMMPRFLGEFRNGVDELDGGGKIFELKGARDGVALLFPIGHGGEGGFDLSGTQFVHTTLVPKNPERVTPKLGERRRLRVRKDGSVIALYLAHDADARCQGPNPGGSEDSQAS